MLGKALRTLRQEFFAAALNPVFKLLPLKE